MKGFEGTVFAQIESERQLRAEMRKWARIRAAASGDRRTRTCPACGGAVELRTEDGMRETLFLCRKCGWWRKEPFQMDEARRFNETFRPKGATIVSVGWDGSLDVRQA
jgi:predicted RNA-binding Zn-ribbon protein involved in translation (DUF1610 family)